MSTPAVDPHVRPSGRAAQFLTTIGFGFGRLLSAGSTTSLCERGVVVNTTNRPTATRARVLRRLERTITTPSAAAILARRGSIRSEPRTRTQNTEPRTQNRERLYNHPISCSPPDHPLFHSEPHPQARL